MCFCWVSTQKTLKMSFVDSMADWFTDPSRALPKKMVVAVVILLGIMMVNDLLGFAYYYRMNKKVENFERLTKIIGDSGTDSTSRAKAFVLREEVVCKQPDYLVFMNIFGKFCRSISAVRKTTVPITETTTKIAANVSIRNEVLFFVSSSGIYVIIGIIAMMIMLFHKRQPIVQKLAGAVTFFLLFLIVSIAMYYLTNLIPILFSNWSFNYIANILIQIGSIALWIILGKKLS
jgi:hypothetical protein